MAPLSGTPDFAKARALESTKEAHESIESVAQSLCSRAKAPLG